MPLAFLVIVSGVTIAESKEKSLVVLLSLERCCPEHAWPEAERRIQKELVLSNLSILVLDAPSSHAGRYAPYLEQVAAQHDAEAVVAVYRSTDTELPILAILTRSEANTPKLQEIEIQPRPSEETAEIVAIRAVEAIGAAVPSENGAADTEQPLEQLGTGAQEDSSPVAGSSPHAPPYRFRLVARFLAEGALGGVGIMGAAGLGLRWRFFRQFSVDFDSTLSVVGGKVENEARTAESSFDILMARLGFGWEALEHGVLRPYIGLSVGVAYLWTTGSAQAEGVDTRTERTAQFVAGGVAELNLAVSKRVWIPIGIQLGVMPPGVKIRFAGETIAELRTAFMEASLGVAVHL